MLAIFKCFSFTHSFKYMGILLWCPETIEQLCNQDHQRLIADSFPRVSCSWKKIQSSGLQSPTESFMIQRTRTTRKDLRKQSCINPVCLFPSLKDSPEGKKKSPGTAPGRFRILLAWCLRKPSDLILQNTVGNQRVPWRHFRGFFYHLILSALSTRRSSPRFCIKTPAATLWFLDSF